MEPSEIHIVLNANSLISDLLKYNEELIIQKLTELNKNFNRLKNPVLRKVLAKRVSVAQACRIAGCSLNEFFDVLKPLGFKAAHEAVEVDRLPLPLAASFTKIIDLDARPILAAGNDPLKMILTAAAGLKNSEVLKVINTFEPVPLINLLENKGYRSFLDIAGPELVNTYFLKKEAQPDELIMDISELSVEADGLTELMKAYQLYIMDVRPFQMPKPMTMILDKLETLKTTEALYVRHRKVPVHLLPVLKERGFDFRIMETADAVILFIYRP
ncbi:DUF2249 domain-containing protein [Mucilaginibacter sp. 3215]|uniref:DUF2249 domain-containing protein n=1 Tax=Mucilaginibacter sp. 3215 TaxID=3373912 RepID=UPI003D2264D2